MYDRRLLFASLTIILSFTLHPIHGYAGVSGRNNAVDVSFSTNRKYSLIIMSEILWFLLQYNNLSYNLNVYSKCILPLSGPSDSTSAIAAGGRSLGLLRPTPDQQFRQHWKCRQYRQFSAVIPDEGAADCPVLFLQLGLWTAAWSIANICLTNVI